MDTEKANGVAANGEHSGDIEQPENPWEGVVEDDLVTAMGADDPEDSVMALHEIDDLHLEHAVLQRRIRDMSMEMEQTNVRERSYAAELEGKLIRLQEELSLASSEKEKACAEAESNQLSAKALEADKGFLEVQLRKLESRMANIQSVKEDAEAAALKMEDELRSAKKELKVNLEKASSAAKEKEEEIVYLKEELMKYTEDLDMVRGKAKALVLNKDEDDAAIWEELRVARERIEEFESEKENELLAASSTKNEVTSLKNELKPITEKFSAETATEKEKARIAEIQQEEVINLLKMELRIAREKVKVLEAEKEKIFMVVSKAVEEITSLKNELKAVREMANAEIANEEGEARISVAEAISSLMEEFRLTKEKGREELEIQKKQAASVLAEKENEIVALRQELVLAREQGMEEVYARKSKVVADMEVETLPVKEQLRQPTVDAQRREELEMEVKELKDHISELEGRIKGLQFNVDSDASAQNRPEINFTGEKPKISWVAIAATAAWTGTVVAAITAFYLHQSRKS